MFHFRAAVDLEERKLLCFHIALNSAQAKKDIQHVIILLCNYSKTANDLHFLHKQRS